MYQKHPNTYPMFLMFYDSSDSSLIFDASPHVTTRPRRENAEEKITTVPRQHLSAACPRDPTNLRRPKRPGTESEFMENPRLQNPQSWKIMEIFWKIHGKIMENSGFVMENPQSSPWLSLSHPRHLTGSLGKTWENRPLTSETFI